MTSSLSELIKMICEDNYIPRSMIEDRIQDEYGHFSSLEDSIDRFFCEYGLNKGLRELLDRRILVRMARNKDHSCPRDAVIDEAIKRLFKGLGIAFPPDLNMPLGPKLIKRKLNELQEKVEEFEHSITGRPEDLRPIPLDAWSYIEHLLSITIQFYAEALANSDEQVKRAFIHAKDQKSLRPILQAMRGIENKFIDDEAKLEAIRVIGRPSPFANFQFDQYDNEVAIQASRNFYAHRTPEEIQEQGVTPVKDSLLLALKLVKEFDKERIAPSIIYFTSKGWDAYDRPLYHFVAEEDMSSNRRMFRSHHKDDKLLRPYLTVSPVKDIMVNPPVISLK